jgi:ankyrin repeat protein
MVRRAEETPGAVAAARAAEAALLHAARVGTAEDVRACASRVAGSSLADIDAPGSHGVTPLHAAATRGDVDVARALLDAGAAACHSHARPLRADAESGWTATHRAMYHGKWRVVQALLERGGSLDHPPDLAGRTPLDVLASRLRRSRERRATLKRDALRAKQTTRRGE